MDGHVVHQCKVSTLNPAAQPFYLDSQKGLVQTPRHLEPAFTDVVITKEGLPETTLPEQKGPFHVCFIERDEAFHREVEKLSHAVVIHEVDSMDAG